MTNSDIIPQDKLDTVRQMLCLGVTIPQIAREIEEWLSKTPRFDVAGNIGLREVFRFAFSLSVGERKVLSAWKSDGSGEIDDTALNTILLTYIVRARDRWDCLKYDYAQWVMRIDVEYWERVVSVRPSSIPESCWKKITNSDQSELRLLHNGYVEHRFRAECLAAQIQQMSLRVEVPYL